MVLMFLIKAKSCLHDFHQIRLQLVMRYDIDKLSDWLDGQMSDLEVRGAYPDVEEYLMGCVDLRSE